MRAEDHGANRMRPAGPGIAPSPDLPIARSHGFSATRFAAATAVALLAACAPLEWRREGTGAADSERDLAECRDGARLRARHEAPLHGFPPPHPFGVDSRGRILTGYAARYDTERALLEHDLTRRCMRERGYELVPVGKRQADDEVRR